MGGLKERIRRLEAAAGGNDGRAWTAVRVYLDPEYPDRFTGPTTAEINARRSAGVQVTEVNVVLDDGD